MADGGSARRDAGRARSRPRWRPPWQRRRARRRAALGAGDHQGGVIVDKGLTPSPARPGARIVGRGEGHVVILDAPGGQRSTGLTITGSGLKLETEDSGVFVTERATGAA